MSAQPNLPNYLTEEKHLTMEGQAAYRSEYLDGEVFAMAGTSYTYSLITLHLGTITVTARCRLITYGCKCRQWRIGVPQVVCSSSYSTPVLTPIPCLTTLCWWK
jgi:hypothetical protein